MSFERGFDADPLRSYLDSLRLIADLRPRLVYPGHGRPFGDAASRIEAILRNKVRRLETIRRAIREQPSTVTELADRLVAKAVLAHQRQLAISETLAHIAYLRWSGVVERRTRPDGVYEWFATGDGPLEVDALLTGEALLQGPPRAARGGGSGVLFRRRCPLRRAPARSGAGAVASWRDRLPAATSRAPRACSKPVVRSGTVASSAASSNPPVPNTGTATWHRPPSASRSTATRVSRVVASSRRSRSGLNGMPPPRLVRAAASDLVDDLGGAERQEHPAQRAGVRRRRVLGESVGRRPARAAWRPRPPADRPARRPAPRCR